MTAPRRAAGSKQPLKATDSDFRPVQASQGVPALRIVVRMPPSTNRLYATVRNRRVKTEEARDYTEHVKQAVWLWKQLHGAPPRPPYRLTITLYPPTNRRIDVSNGIKCLEDSIFAGLEGNDRTVNEVTCRTGGKDVLNPRAEAVLEHMEGA